MSLARIFDIAAAIVTVALVTVLVRKDSNTAEIIKATTGGFSDSLRAAMGK